MVVEINEKKNGGPKLIIEDLGIDCRQNLDDVINGIQIANFFKLVSILPIKFGEWLLTQLSLLTRLFKFFSILILILLINLSLVGNHFYGF